MREKKRCKWCIGDPIYKAYHDMEWGVPLKEDQSLFEFLTLETFQAGLSWITILRKRENFRLAFDGFDYRQIAKYSETKIQTLLDNTGIVRNLFKFELPKITHNAFKIFKRNLDPFHIIFGVLLLTNPFKIAIRITPKSPPLRPWLI